MTRTLPLLFILLIGFTTFGIQGQEIKLKKGIITDSLIIRDSIPETYALFLPSTFDLKGKWPLLTVIQMEGRAKQEMSKFIAAANKYGYVVASSNGVHDSLSLSENMVRTKQMIDHLVQLLPINKSRIYTAGFEDSARFANLVPLLLKDIQGAISINAAIANIELLNSKNTFQFIGIVDKENYNFPTLLQDEKDLNELKFQNSILVGKTSISDVNKRINRALEHFDLLAMSKGLVSKDSTFVKEAYQKHLAEIDLLLQSNEYLLANRLMAETMNIFRIHLNTDSLREIKRQLKRNKAFRLQKREEEAAFFKELFLRDDFTYYLEEDVLTYNFNNLGWWNYQKAQIDRYSNSSNKAEREMGSRLSGFVVALIEDNIDVVQSQKTIDEEALVFLYMLKTILLPQEFKNYLKVASIAAKNEDFGTALFYLEEALKNGFKSREELYSIPNTALLRITPEFNALIEKYFSEARYKIKDE